jgi:hypothetical protein
VPRGGNSRFWGDCNHWRESQAQGQRGDAGVTGSNWIAGGERPCSLSARLYCIETPAYAAPSLPLVDSTNQCRVMFVGTQDFAGRFASAGQFATVCVVSAFYVY